MSVRISDQDLQEQLAQDEALLRQILNEDQGRLDTPEMRDHIRASAEIEESDEIGDEDFGDLFDDDDWDDEDDDWEDWDDEDDWDDDDDWGGPF